MPSLLKDDFAAFLVDSFFPPALWICDYTVFWPLLFLIESQLVIMLMVLCTYWVIFLFMLTGFFLCVCFQQFDCDVSKCGSLCIYSIWNWTSHTSQQHTGRSKKKLKEKLENIFNRIKMKTNIKIYGMQLKQFIEVNL